MNDEQLKEIGNIVCEEARERFATCGAESDFCVQSIGFVAVFGGTNRVIWSPKHGWSLDQSYCTERFIRAWLTNYKRN